MIVFVPNLQFEGSPVTSTDTIPSSEVPVLDESRLLEAFGDDPEILVELRDLYVQHCPPLLEEIRVAFESGDGQAVASKAHSLKGASATYGALRVFETCRVIEMLAKAGNLAATGEHIERLATELTEVIVHIGRLGGES